MYAPYSSAPIMTPYEASPLSTLKVASAGCSELGLEPFRALTRAVNADARLNAGDSCSAPVATMSMNGHHAGELIA